MSFPYQCKRALGAAKDDYDNHNISMMEDMPKLYEGRIDYLTPSFQALIKAQVSLTRYFCRKGLKLTKDASVNLVSGLGFRKGSGARHRLGSDPPLMGN